MNAPLRAELVCSQGCAFAAPVTEVVYQCPACAGLLEVRHDVAALQARSPQEWKELFSARYGEASLPNASGIWGKKEWVLPELPQEHIVSLGEGHGPLLPLPRMARELGLSSLELKACGVSPTGSFKDLGMTVLVSAVKWMRARGQRIRAVACASTGDTSAAVSAYCAAAGIPSVVFLPRGKVSIAQLLQPISNGALVLSLDTDFDGCMRVVREVTANRSIYLANSMNSLRLEGQKIVAAELCQQRGWQAPDWVVIPGGNLGNASALAMGFTLLLALGLIDRLPRIAVGQAHKANPLYRSFQTGFLDTSPVHARATLASAIQIGDPVSMKRAIRALKAFDGVVEEASESELANASARADREGAYCCPQTGVALAALERLCAKGVVAPQSQVVVISTAHGLKFSSFKESYHLGRLPEVESVQANPPVEVGATCAEVERVLDRRLA
ncbi:MAG: threonine synthase [Myxococcota bacterium]